jgi:Tol biopolymer transport system component
MLVLSLIRKSLLALVSAGLALLVVWVSPVASQTAVGTIVYQRVPENSGPWPTIDIYSINADGTNDRALTHDGHSNTPSWSPDGQQILFIHDDPSHHPIELYEMNGDGSDPHLLTHLEPSISSAAWSPDGTEIVIQAAGARPLPPGSYVYLFSPASRENPRLLFPFRAVRPAWSPDGKKLLFFKEGNWTPFVANTDDSNEIELKNVPSFRMSDPAWSPDGTFIAFANVEQKGSDAQVFVMNADGSGARQLTHDPAWQYCHHPSWSPDGERIAFSCTSTSAPCSAHGPIDDAGRPITPWCVKRLFIIAVNNPPEHLTPITDSYGENPSFAPK